ncbi:MAG: 2-succinyl-6-hydroxy-2,4-cyclohexadiene-1-carboxylate synthase [Actinomycetota bacterium]|nr:2-succinyl-6-hydroxy-2,4-cyclohexadiene-1-carboxylate synthase [Actinomycetota bacterium]
MADLGYAPSGDPRRPAVLFLHGFMGSSADWREVTASLETEYRCIAVDLPGHGSSLGLPPEAYTIDGTTGVLLNLLDELDVERPLVVGYSMGGRLALYLALRHPDLCSRLFLESASPGIEDAAQREVRRNSDGEKAARLESGDLEGFLNDWYAQPLFASLARRPEVLKRSIEARIRNDPTELARSLRGMGTGEQPPLWGELDALGIPTLVVAGELDERYAIISAHMASLNPLIRARVVAGVGHNVHLEAPEACLALLGCFLRDPGVTSPSSPHR